ncbi:MAG: hypothetical protein ACLGIZ_04310 [Acidimicrobiia bacterium]
MIDPRAGQITLAEYAAQWQAAQMHRPSTAEATESRLRRHVVPTFGHRPIGSLRPSEMRRGEALGLSVDRAVFLRRQLAVDRQLLKVAGAADAFGPRKTRASVRTVPVPDIVLEDLSRHLATFPAEPDSLLFVNARAGRGRTPASPRCGAPPPTGPASQTARASTTCATTRPRCSSPPAVR